MDFPFMTLILWYVYIYILISLYIYIFIYIYNRLCIIYYYIILYPMTPRYNQRSPRMTRHRKRLRLKGKDSSEVFRERSPRESMDLSLQSIDLSLRRATTNRQTKTCLKTLGKWCFCVPNMVILFGFMAA
jgi:hypothetical protein